jgi:ABC-2 type transport system ATP-binding protein
MFLSFNRVTKFYGPVIGVNDISCRIGPGITGLFGANGAGKSTLLKLASGQLRPSLGEVLIDDVPAWSTRAKRLFGYTPDLDRFYEEMTGREFVYTMARLYGFTAGEARLRTDEVLAEVGMTERAGRSLAGCSHGMRQRIKLAQSLVHDPPVLLLDEPLNGIDPGGRREISELLVRQAERGKTILVSSHILNEVEQLTDSILMIAGGRIVASGTLQEIRMLMDDQPFTVEIVAADSRKLAGMLVQEAEIRSVDLREETLVVRTRNPGHFFALLADLAHEHRLEIERFEVIDANASAVFDYLQGTRG